MIATETPFGWCLSRHHGTCRREFRSATGVHRCSCSCHSDQSVQQEWTESAMIAGQKATAPGADALTPAGIPGPTDQALWEE